MFISGCWQTLMQPQSYLSFVQKNCKNERVQLQTDSSAQRKCNYTGKQSLVLQSNNSLHSLFH